MKVNSNIFKYSKKLNFLKLTRKYFSGGHHHISGKVDAERVFVPLKSETKNNGLFSVCGLPSDKVDESSYHSVSEHGPRFLLTANPFEIIHRPTKLADVPMEDNPYAHEDIYGYTLGDDVRLILK